MLSVKTAVTLDKAQFAGCSHGRLRAQLQQQDWVTAEAHGDVVRSAAMLKKFSDANEMYHKISPTTMINVFYTTIKDFLSIL